MLLEVEDADTAERMTNVQLRDEVITIFLAGHETTATALSWTFQTLSLQPRVAEQLQHELDTLLAGRAPLFEEIPRMRFTAQVFQESMRLRPPVWVGDTAGG